LGGATRLHSQGGIAELREYRQAATDKAAAAEAELSDAMATIRTLTKLGETT